MTLSRVFQVTLATIPFLAISIGLEIFFYVNDIGIYTMFPTVMFGVFPLIIVLCNKFRFLPAENRPTQFQWFRVFITILCWAVMTIASIMISFLIRLVNSYNWAATSILLYACAIVTATIAVVSTFSQQLAEINVRPLFSDNVDDDDPENVKELDVEFKPFSLDLDPVYKKMEKEVTSNRKLAMSQSINCGFLSIVMLIMAFAATFPIKTFDIFEQPSFNFACINQSVLNARQQSNMGFLSYDLTSSQCSYSPCSRAEPFSIDPPLPSFFGFRPDFAKIWADASKNISLSSIGCETFTVFQTCDNLGFHGIIGSVRIGTNCSCKQQQTENLPCKMQKNAPQPFNWFNIYGVFFLLFVWTSIIRNKVDFMRWNTLRIRFQSKNEPQSE